MKGLTIDDFLDRFQGVIGMKLKAASLEEWEEHLDKFTGYERAQILHVLSTTEVMRFQSPRIPDLYTAAERCGVYSERKRKVSGVRVSILDGDCTVCDNDGILFDLIEVRYGKEGQTKERVGTRTTSEIARGDYKGYTAIRACSCKAGERQPSIMKGK